MAAGRCDQRKNFEEEEANAIGTQYVRADLLSGTAAARVRGMLKRYVEKRILFYTLRDAQALADATATSAKMQSEM